MPILFAFLHDLGQMGQMGIDFIPKDVIKGYKTHCPDYGKGLQK